MQNIRYFGCKKVPWSEMFDFNCYGNNLGMFGKELLVIILGSKRGRNVGPRPHRPLLPRRLDKAPGKSIILSVLYRFGNWCYFSDDRKIVQGTTAAAPPNGNIAQPASLVGPGDSLALFLARMMISAVIYRLAETVISYINHSLGISGSQ